MPGVPLRDRTAPAAPSARSGGGAGPYSALVTADGRFRRLPRWWTAHGPDRHAPRGRLASVAFYPAHSGAEQTLDLWLLDLTTRDWRQLPDMPLRLAPSKPQVTWTADGRLLLLAGLADDPASGLVAVWRPGQPRIAVRRVPLPDPGPPSGFRFVLW